MGNQGLSYPHSSGDHLVPLNSMECEAHARENRYIVGRLTNTLGWFHSEFGDVARAIEHDQTSVDVGRTTFPRIKW